MDSGTNTYLVCRAVPNAVLFQLRGLILRAALSTSVV